MDVKGRLSYLEATFQVQIMLDSKTISMKCAGPSIARLDVEMSHSSCLWEIKAQHQCLLYALLGEFSYKPKL